MSKENFHYLKINPFSDETVVTVYMDPSKAARAGLVPDGSSTAPFTTINDVVRYLNSIRFGTSTKFQVFMTCSEGDFFEFSTQQSIHHQDMNDGVGRFEFYNDNPINTLGQQNPIRFKINIPSSQGSYSDTTAIKITAPVLLGGSMHFFSGTGITPRRNILLFGISNTSYLTFWRRHGNLNTPEFRFDGFRIVFYCSGNSNVQCTDEHCSYWFDPLKINVCPYHSTTDINVIETKTYYTYDSTVNDFVVVNTPSGNPLQLGYKEADTSTSSVEPVVSSTRTKLYLNSGSLIYIETGSCFIYGGEFHFHHTKNAFVISNDSYLLLQPASSQDVYNKGLAIVRSLVIEAYNTQNLITFSNNARVFLYEYNSVIKNQFYNENGSTKITVFKNQIRSYMITPTDSWKGNAEQADYFRYNPAFMKSDIPGIYTRSTDLIVDSNKTYYTLSRIDNVLKYVKVVDPSGNPQENEYYERNILTAEDYAYVITTDVTAVSEKTYYERLVDGIQKHNRLTYAASQAALTVAENPVFNGQNTYYELVTTGLVYSGVYILTNVDNVTAQNYYPENAGIVTHGDLTSSDIRVTTGVKSSPHESTVYPIAGQWVLYSNGMKQIWFTLEQSSHYPYINLVEILDTKIQFSNTHYQVFITPTFSYSNPTSDSGIAAIPSVNVLNKTKTSFQFDDTQSTSHGLSIYLIGF